MSKWFSNNKMLIYGVVGLLLVLLIVSLGFVFLDKSTFKQPQQNVKFKNIQYKDPATNKIRALKIPAHYPERLYKVQCPKGICPMLGRGYDLRKINLKDPTKIPAGKQVFLSTKMNILTNPNCFEYNIGTQSLDVNSTLSKNTTDTIKNITAEFSANASLPIDTMIAKATVDATTSSNSLKSTNIQTASLSISSVDGDVTFLDETNRKCRSSALNTYIINDFYKLYYSAVQDPGLESSWNEFENFFKRWGTHIVVKVVYGSKIEVWNSLEGVNTDISKQIKTKACMSLESNKKPLEGFQYQGAPAAPVAAKPVVPDAPDGPVSPAEPKPALKQEDISLSTCAGITNEDRRKSSSLNTQDKKYIVGGGRKQRNALVNFVDMNTNGSDAIAFLNSSEDGNTAIGYRFEPIWDVMYSILATKCENGEDPYCDGNKGVTQRCINLQFAFMREAIACPMEKTDKGVIYQEIQARWQPGGFYLYGCYQRNTGCNTNSECKYWNARCYAMGNEMFERGPEYNVEYSNPTDKKQYRSQIRGADNWKSYSDASSNTCQYKAGTGCLCKSGYGSVLPNRFIWTQKWN